MIDIEEKIKRNVIDIISAINGLRSLLPSGDYENALVHKGIQALEKQQAEIEQLKKENEWISIEDRLPQDNTKVLSRYEGVYECDVVIFWRDTANLHFGHNPATHWKPLPKPPEGKS